MATCIFLNCNNVQKPYSSLNFFCLPDDDRSSTWITASGNHGLQCAPDQLKLKQVVCEKHFANSLLRKLNQRTILHQHAVPTPWYENYSNTNNAGKSKKSVSIMISFFRNFLFSKTGAEIFNIQTKSMGTEANIDINTPAKNSDIDLPTIEPLIDIDPTIKGFEYDDDIVYCYDIEEDAHPAVDRLEDKEIDKTNGVSCTDESSKNISFPAEPVNLLPDPQEVKRTIIQPRKRYRKPINKKVQHCCCCKKTLFQPKMFRSKKKLVQKPQILSEDTHFALSLVDSLERMNPMKKAEAKIGILKYLSEIYGRSSS